MLLIISEIFVYSDHLLISSVLRIEPLPREDKTPQNDTFSTFAALFNSFITHSTTYHAILVFMLKYDHVRSYVMSNFFMHATHHTRKPFPCWIPGMYSFCWCPCWCTLCCCSGLHTHRSAHSAAYCMRPVCSFSLRTLALGLDVPDRHHTPCPAASPASVRSAKSVYPALDLHAIPVFKDFVFATSLLGGIFGTVLPAGVADYYPLFSFQTIQTIMLHGLLIYVPLAQILSGRHRPDLRRFHHVLCLFLAVVFVVGFIDFHFDQNYMFLFAPPEGTPLVLVL